MFYEVLISPKDLFLQVLSVSVYLECTTAAFVKLTWFSLVSILLCLSVSETVACTTVSFAKQPVFACFQQFQRSVYYCHFRFANLGFCQRVLLGVLLTLSLSLYYCRFWFANLGKERVAFARAQRKQKTLTKHAVNRFANFRKGFAPHSQ